MGRTHRRSVVLGAVWIAASAATLAQGTLVASIAFIRNNALTIAARHGEVLDTVLMRPPVSDFAVSPDRRLVVVVANSTPHGGDLELIDLRVRQRAPLLSAPVYFTNLKQGEREVYADPRFSPDGEHVVFAVRTYSPTDATDAIGASGPLAVMDISTRQVHIVKSTANIDGHRLCYANTPLWSHDGSKLLFSCESRFAVTPADGSSLRILTAGSDLKPWTSAIAWIGRRCILYVEAKDGVSPDRDVRLMDLITGQTHDAAPLLLRQRAEAAGLVEVSSDAGISRGSQVTIHTSSNIWVLPRDAPAHLLTSWRREDIPSTCR